MFVAQANAVRIVGYALCIIIGAVLWPRLIEWGFKLENTNFVLAILLSWFCIPVSAVIIAGISWVTMHMASAVDRRSTAASVREHTKRAAVFGVLATFASCGMIISGVEPPPPLDGIYDVDLTSKFN